MNSKIKNDNGSKILNILILIIIIVLIILSCVLLYKSVTKSKSKKNIVQEEIDMESVILTKEELPRVDATIVAQPLINKILTNFTGEEINIKYTNTYTSYIKLINKEVDLIIVPEPTLELIKLASTKNVEFDTTKLINEAFVFMVNSKNNINDISLDDIKKIYTGELKNWKDLDGTDNEILAFQFPNNSINQIGFLKLVMKDNKLKEPVILNKDEETKYGDMSYDNGLYSIGYSYYYIANNIYKDDNIKYIGINGIKPKYETISDGTYPVLETYYIVTRKDETNESVNKLKEAILSKRGEKIISNEGYVLAK